MKREMRIWAVLWLLAGVTLLLPAGALAAPSITEGPYAGSTHTGIDWGQEEYGIHLWVRVTDTGGLGNIQSVQASGPDSSVYTLYDDGNHCDDGPGDGAYGWCDWQKSTPPGLGLYTFIATDKQGGTAIGTDTVERILDFPRNPSPAGATVTTPAPLLSWSPVSGAMRYNLEVRDQEWNQVWERHDIMSTAILYNDDGTAFPLVDGASYQWGVGAYDDQGNDSWHHTAIAFAYASNPGTISGRVLTTDGLPVADVCVTAQTTICGGWGPLGGMTDENGNYTISVPAGDYYVSTNVNCHGPRYYIDEWWNGSGGTTDCNQALAVSVPLGQNVPNIDFSLVEGGIVEGRITTSAGQPIANVCVNVTDIQCGGPNWYWGQSNQEGDYTVVVPQGACFVQAYAACSGQNYALEWWDNGNGTPDCNAAAAVNVTVGQTTGGIDFSLVEGATISGTVYENDGITPIFNMEVIAVSGDPCGGQQHSGWALTDALGNYTLTGLAPGAYFLTTSNNGHSNYLNEWWTPSGSSVDCNAAQSMTVNPGDSLTDRDFQLDSAGSVSGRITSDGGQPLPNTCVNLYDARCDGNHVGHGITDANGDYSIKGLPQGTYYASTHASCVFQNSYIDEWWDGAGGTTDCNQAAPVQVVAGQDTSGINFPLEEGGSLSGRVTDASGNPIGNVPIWVFHNRCWNGWAGGAQTDGNGEYTVWGLPTGEHFVIAQPKCVLPVNYENQWWNGASGSAVCTIAAPVNVMAGQDTSGIDFSLKEGAPYPAPSFVFAGIFSQNNADGSSGTAIYAFIGGPSPEDVCSFTATGPSGTFHLSPILSFQDLGLMYWGGRNYIVEGGTYTFTITDSLGRSASVSREFCYDNTIPWVDSNTMTPPDGAYVKTTTPTLSFAAVPRGGVSYQVQVKDLAGNAVWYNKSGIEGTSVTLPAGVLQPYTAYIWYVRVRDSEGTAEYQNAADSLSLRFFTGSNAPPLLSNVYIGLLDNPPHGENMGTWVGVVSQNTAPWDVDALTLEDPDGFVHDWTGSINYWFSHPAYFSWYLRDPVPFPDGAYTIRLEDTASRQGAATANYVHSGTVPPVSEEARNPRPNAYLSTDAPTFSWAPLPDAGYEYRVRIRDYNNRIIWYDSLYAPQTTVTIPPVLPRGSSYVWEVMAKPVGGTDLSYSSQSLFTLNPFQDPKPDIQINGQDGPVFVNPGVASNVVISLNPGDLPGEVCDWWIGVLTPFGNYWFTYPSLAWVPSGAPICVGQIGLMNLAPYQVLSHKLPTSVYTFFFILDSNANGKLDDLTWYDYVNVFSSPEGLGAEISLDSAPLSDEMFVNKIKELMKQ